MSDNLLSRYTGRPTESVVEAVQAPEPDGTEDLGSFGWIRGRDRAIMIELRKKTGTIRAIPYSWIEGIDFDPSDGITLHARGEKIRIRGRNLNAESRPQVRLFQGITRQRVPWIQEADHAGSLKAERQAVLVEAIEW